GIHDTPTSELCTLSLHDALPICRRSVGGIRMKGAGLLARALQDAGVTHVFSVSGNHVMCVYDALLDTDIRLIHTRHEAAAVHMRSEEHTSELQSRENLVCRLLLE